MKNFAVGFVVAIGLIVMTSTYPPAFAEIHNHEPKPEDAYNFMSQANQIKFLIGGVIFLFGGNMFWWRRYMSKSDKKEDQQDKYIVDLYEKNTKLVTEFSGLKGEHRTSMNMGMCAANPQILRETIKDAMKEFHVHQRVEDDPQPRREGESK